MLIPEIELVVSRDGAVFLAKILRPGAYVFGSSAAADIQVSAEQVAERHAELTVGGSKILIEDLGSAAGTWVNGKRITERTRLWPNQTVQIGAATLTLRRLKTPDEAEQTLAADVAAVRRLLPPEFLREAKYEIGGIIAQGGMGAILDAREATTERTVAMKVMLDGSSPAALARFVTEAKITAQLEHPNIVPVHELSVDEHEQLFYTMKFVRGITLGKVLDELAGGAPAMLEAYPIGVRLTVFQKVCDAVGFAHSKGIIHRDLKPANIMLGDFGEVLVMDWGLAKVVAPDGAEHPTSNGGGFARSVGRAVRAEEASHTVAGSIMGTPQYMAPEQARGEIGALDTRTDIYALGAILFHLLHLRGVVSGSDSQEIVEKVQRGEVEWRSPKSAVRDPQRAIPPSLLAVCRKALAAVPAQRYQHVGQLQADLSAFQNGFATSAEKAGTWKVLRLLVRRNKAAAAGIAAVLIVGSIFGTGAFLQGRRAERALADLRGTAPTFHAQALALRDEGRFDEALAKLDFALQLAPEHAGHHRLRGELLQSALRLPEAIAAFREALRRAPQQADVQANLALTERLLRENRGGTVSRESLRELHAAFLAQGRRGEALAFATHHIGRDELLRSYQDRIAAAYGQATRGDVAMAADGTVTFYARQSKRVNDLRPLRGIPISELSVDSTAITDLAGLEGMPLRSLDIGKTKVRDLAPLHGAPLVVLAAHATELHDLTPLAGMPLEFLRLDGASELRDLAPLRGMKLRELNLANCSVSDLSALRGMPLRSLLAPRHTDAAALQTIAPLPLEHLELNHSRFADLAPIRTMKLVSLALEYSEVRDISAVRGMPLREISLGYCRHLTDISPLADCPQLDRINAQGSGVTDLAPLRGLRLTFLAVTQTGVTDVSPLLDLPALEMAVVPRAAQNLAVLRRHPRLKYLGWEGDQNADSHRLELTASEFWARYDAQQTAAGN